MSLATLGIRDEEAALRAVLEEAGLDFSEGREASLRIYSCDPLDGCPDVMVLVSADGSQRLRIERASLRPIEGGASEWSQEIVDQASTLCERAEHVLGAPVGLDLVEEAALLRIVRARRVWLSPAYLPAPYHLVSLLWQDEGPIAPLAVDVLALALEQDVEGAVIRAFARPYRRTTTRHRVTEGESSLVERALRTAEAILEAREPIGEVKALRNTVLERCEHFDAIDLSRLPASSLMRSLLLRRNLAAEAEAWLDRARAVTGVAFDAIRASIPDLDPSIIADLSVIRPSEERLRREQELAEFGKALLSAFGHVIPEPSALPPHLQSTLSKLRITLSELRPLGLDVRPLPYGSSDRQLIEAGIRLAKATDPELRRSQATEALLATLPSRLRASARHGLVRSLLALLDRLASLKGEVADLVALALLRLRACAIEIGGRLVEEGILEQPEDALYLSSREIEASLRGEAVAFASRVRVRREEDIRFRNFSPPERLSARSW
ncbi:MAG: hypothetical protein NZM37_03620 [Sandaracinaceae bacterium]|nr:hypothetical protein [Sandaracinaceae bacterium]